MPSLRAAIDLSGPFGAFAVSGPDAAPRSSICLPLEGRDNSGFFNSILAAASDNSFSINEINEWIVGTGPGSFTGLRVAAAFVKGATFQRTDTHHVRGVQSSLAMAAAAAKLGTDGDCAVLRDGKRGSLLATPFKLAGPAAEPTPIGGSVFIPSGEVEPALARFKHLVILAADRFADSIPKSLEPKLLRLDSFPINEMLQMWDSPRASRGANLELSYVRPPVIFKSAGGQA